MFIHVSWLARAAKSVDMEIATIDRGSNMVPLWMLVKGATAVGTAALKQWRSLPEEQRRQVQSEAAAVMTSTADLSRAVVRNAGRFRAGRRSKKWERRRDEVLTSPPEFMLAKHLVVLVQEQGPLGEEQLAALVGADDKDDPALVRALGYARDARLVIDEGGLLEAATEDSILWNNKSLRATGYIDELEARIRAYLLAEGFGSLDDIASSLQVATDDPSLLAALHRTLSNGHAQWINIGIYGLPVEQLRRFERSADVEASEPAELRAAAARLYDGAQALRKATAHPPTPSNPDLLSSADSNCSVPSPRPTRFRDTPVLHPFGRQDTVAVLPGDGDDKEAWPTAEQ